MIARTVFNRLVKGYRTLSKSEEVGPTIIQRPSKVVQIYPQIPFIERPVEKPTKVKKKEIRVKVKGIEIPVFSPRAVRISKMKPEEEKIERLTYPLVPSKPKKGEPIFAYADIAWDPVSHKHVYNLIEPKLSPELGDILNKIKDLLEQRLDIDFSKLRKFEAAEYLSKEMNELVNYFDFRINEIDKKVLKYYIERDFIGLGKIEPFMRDENIEDISCDGVGIPLFVFHRNPKISSVITNISYENSNELDSFITRLVQLCGKSISVAEPLRGGALPDGSRLQAMLATDIARRGSNFTIRKFTKIPLTPIHLLGYGTLDVKILAYLWMLVDYGFSILISGGTASGKTTMLNVLSLFIRADKKIVSIEDTAELQLPHPHWVPSVARTSISGETGEKRSEVDLFDLLKESFRQRPDYVIVGEVRGSEAFILFQQMATGHPSLSTIHSENMPKLMDRLTTPPISLPHGLIDSLDVAVFLTRMKYKEKFVRKITEVVEVIKYDPDIKEPITNEVFKWDPMTDKFDTRGDSIVLKRLAQRTGMKEKEVTEEIERRMAVLSWMEDNDILDYRDVNKVINFYYNYPQRTMAMIMSQM